MYGILPYMDVKCGLLVKKTNGKQKYLKCIILNNDRCRGLPIKRHKSCTLKKKRVLSATHIDKKQKDDMTHPEKGGFAQLKGTAKGKSKRQTTTLIYQKIGAGK